MSPLSTARPPWPSLLGSLPAATVPPSEPPRDGPLDISVGVAQARECPGEITTTVAPRFALALRMMGSATWALTPIQPS